MDEGVKQNCHSTAESLINCQGGWRVWQASLEKGAPRCRQGPRFWHLLQKENTPGVTTALHKKQMVLTIPWVVIPRESTHSCVSEKFARKPCSAPQSHQQLWQVTPALPAGMLMSKPSTHSIILLFIKRFYFQFVVNDILMVIFWGIFKNIFLFFS